MLVIVIKCFLSSTIPFAFLKGDYTEIQVRKVKNQGGSVSGLKFFCLFIYLLTLLRINGTKVTGIIQMLMPERKVIVLFTFHRVSKCLLMTVFPGL